MFSEGLGRLYNAHYPADDVYISLRDAAGITFFVHEVDGASVITTAFASDAAGAGSVSPAVIDHYYAKSFDVNNGTWRRTNIALASGFTKADGTEDLVAIEILANMAPAGKPWVKCAVDGSGIVFALTHDLAYGRAPQNLRSLTA